MVIKGPSAVVWEKLIEPSMVIVAPLAAEIVTVSRTSQSVKGIEGPRQITYRQMGR